MRAKFLLSGVPFLTTSFPEDFGKEFDSAPEGMECQLVDDEVADGWVEEPTKELPYVLFVSGAILGAGAVSKPATVENAMKVALGCVMSGLKLEVKKFKEPATNAG